MFKPYNDGTFLSEIYSGVESLTWTGVFTDVDAATGFANIKVCMAVRQKGSTLMKGLQHFYGKKRLNPKLKSMHIFTRTVKSYHHEYFGVFLQFSSPKTI